MAAKVKDGLFIGDAETSQDPEFLELNKISNLVNLSAREVPNVWASHGLVYLNYNWDDRPDFKLFDDHDDAVADLVEFVDTSLRHGVSVLLFSRRGVGRCAAAMAAYLMYKYHWGFEKAYDFLYSKKPDIDINKGFVQQLFELDKRLHMRWQQQARGQFTASDPSLELLRRREWDPGYIQSDLSAPQPRHNQVQRDDVIDETPDDELVLINSFLNSKQTISSLPGPYRNAIDVPKAFKLRFNSELQEEDIHMFPTSPPKGHAAVARKGILKRRGHPHSHHGHNAQTHGANHGQVQNIPVHHGQIEHPTHALVSTSGSRAVGGGVRGPSTDGYEQLIQQGINPGGRAAGQAFDNDEKDDRDLLSVGSADAYYAPKPSSHQPQEMSTQPRARGSSASAAPGLPGHRDSINRKPVPQPTGPQPTQGRPYNQPVDDLYQFIGLGVSGYQPVDPRTIPGPSGVAGPSQMRAQGPSRTSAEPLTVEDRLRHLVADMQVGSEAHAEAARGKQRVGPSQAQGIESSQDSRKVATDRTYRETGHPSLYDLANMHALANGTTNGAVRSSSQGLNMSNMDPLSAFEMMQQGGAIRVRHDVVAGGRGYSGPTSSAPPQPRNAWADSDAAQTSSGRRGSSPASATQQLAAQSAPRTYRHGSPAPNRMARSGPGAATGPTAAAPGSSTRGAWTGGSSGGSVTSLNSAGSQQSRYGTPVSSSNRDAGVSRTTAPNSYATAKRDGSPSQTQRKSAERPMSPGPQAQAQSKMRGGPTSSPMRAGPGYGAAVPNSASAGQQRRMSADNGETASYSSLGSMVSDSQHAGGYSATLNNTTRTRAASPMASGSQRAFNTAAGQVPGARPSTPTRSWRF